MLILSARGILAISIFSRWLAGSDWFSQGQEADEAAVRATSCAGAERAEEEPADAEAAVASPAGSKTARSAAAAIPGRRLVREPRMLVIARPPLPADGRGRSHPGEHFHPCRTDQSNPGPAGMPRAPQGNNS